MQKIEILNSVGNNGKNKAIDIALIQALLKNYFHKSSIINNDPLNNYNQRLLFLSNSSRTICNEANWFPSTKTPSPIEKQIHRFDTNRFSRLLINGNPSPVLISAIKKFQTDVVKIKKPDGRIDPRGATLDKLLAEQTVKPTDLRKTLFGPDLVPREKLNTITDSTFKKYFRQYLGLTITKGEDFVGFFEMLKTDVRITDLRWAAYILATAYHETTYSFLPLREAGKGKGERYDKKYEVIDSNGIRGQINKKYTNVYYGRGYVQLTWDYNYKDIGKALGYGNKLYIDPDLALTKNVAYEITSHGMQKGTFTQKKLADYINVSKTDYTEARRIINGEDKKELIAEYANKIEILLRLAAKSLSASA